MDMHILSVVHWFYGRVFKRTETLLQYQQVKLGVSDGIDQRPTYLTEYQPDQVHGFNTVELGHQESTDRDGQKDRAEKNNACKPIPVFQSNVPPGL